MSKVPLLQKAQRRDTRNVVRVPGYSGMMVATLSRFEKKRQHELPATVCLPDEQTARHPGKHVHRHEPYTRLQYECTRTKAEQQYQEVMSTSH